MVGGLDKLVIYDTSQLHQSFSFLSFVLIDFVGWATHVYYESFSMAFLKYIILRRIGFAAHFRMHWMENVIYPNKIHCNDAIGNFDPQHAFIVYYISIAIGHLNHSNIGLSYGPLKYIINIKCLWHHSYELPKNRKYINFGQC